MPYRSRVPIDIHPRLSRPRKLDQQTPFDPPELPPMIMDVTVPLIVTEGVRKADSAVSCNLCCIALMGVSAWHRLPDWNDFPIKDRTVFLCFDSDATQKRPVWIQLRDLKGWLETHGGKVSIIYLPPGPHGEKVGLDDFIAALVTQGIGEKEICVKLLALATDELRPAPGADEKNKIAEGQRPEIFVDRGQLRDKVGKALDALGKKNDPPLLFCRGGILTRLRDNGDVVELEALDDAALLSELSEAANWYRYSRNDEATDADPPANVAKALRGSRQFPFPLIDAVVRAPFFTPDGSLITTSGYHAAARVYVALDSALATQLDAQPLPERPTPEDVTSARALLQDELFCNFPFEDTASKAHAVALTLLPFVRKMIDGPTPNHAVTAPTRGEGTGKGLLVQAACAAALGEIATIPETNDNDELKKFLLAILIEGAPIVLLDNRKHEINSGVLAAVLTARHWQDRILGKTKTARPTVLTTWVITGNAIRVSGEIGRRTIWIRLNANVPEPWKRAGFKHELPRWAHEHRAELIRACIILVNNWISLGRPDGKQTLGSYEDWARVIGGILEAGGIMGFLAEPEKSADDSNEDARRWNPFVERWWERHAAKGVLPKDLIEFAAELVPETEKSTDRSRVTRLGNLLSKSVRQVFAVENVDSYLKIVRAEVERDKGGTRRGYALNRSPKTDIEVGEVGGTAELVKNPAETKENFPANPAHERSISSNEVGEPHMPNGKGKFGRPPTLPTFEDGLDLYPDGDAMDDEERDR
jgi:hypothetical protein